jgi:hypothetical protein
MAGETPRISVVRYILITWGKKEHVVPKAPSHPKIVLIIYLLCIL